MWLICRRLPAVAWLCLLAPRLRSGCADYPALRIIHTDSEAQALALVSERKADLTMRSLTVAAYTIKKRAGSI